MAVWKNNFSDYLDEVHVLFVMLVGQWSEVVTMSKSLTIQEFKTVQECKTIQELKAEMNEKQIISIEGKFYQKES